MPQLILQNRGKRALRQGDYVKFVPNNKKGVIYAELGEEGIIGTVNQIILTNGWGTINTLNTINWNNILNRPSVINGRDGEDGFSAYEIAVMQGFDGTPQEWITSLKGDPGIPGNTGLTGASGTNDIGIVVDGGTSVLTTGIKGYRNIPANLTIKGWTIISDVAGSCIVDVKKTTFATFPTSASITGSQKPTLSGVQKNQLLTLTQWTTSLVQGDIIEFNIESVAIIKKLYLYIHLTHI